MLGEPEEGTAGTTRRDIGRLSRAVLFSPGRGLQGTGPGAHRSLSVWSWGFHFVEACGLHALEQSWASGLRQEGPRWGNASPSCGVGKRALCQRQEL